MKGMKKRLTSAKTANDQIQELTKLYESGTVKKGGKKCITQRKKLKRKRKRKKKEVVC